MTQPLIILDKPLLEAGLFALIADYAAETQDANLDAPEFPEIELRIFATTLSNYLGHFHRTSLRRSPYPLLPTNLKFELLRKRNPIEFDDNADTKSSKDWYDLTLHETEEATGTVQILVDGGLTRDKGMVLEEFMKVVERKVRMWKEAEMKMKSELRLKTWREKQERGEISKGGRPKRKRNKGKVVEDEKRDAGKESKMMTGAGAYGEDERMVDVDDDGDVIQGDEDRNVVQRGRPDEHKRRVRFEETIDDTG